MLFKLSSVVLCAAVAPLAAQALSIHPYSHHSARSNRHSLVRRVTNARTTFYNTETGNRGACGDFIKNTDFALAIAPSHYDNGGACGKTVRIQYKGKTADAVIQDLCPSCGPGGLDLSTELFRFFENPDVGVIEVTWDFVDGSGGGQPQPPPPTPPSPPPQTPPPAPSSEDQPPAPTTSNDPAPEPSNTNAPQPDTTPTTNPAPTEQPPPAEYTPVPSPQPEPESSTTETPAPAPTNTPAPNVIGRGRVVVKNCRPKSESSSLNQGYRRAFGNAALDSSF